MIICYVFWLDNSVLFVSVTVFVLEEQIGNSLEFVLQKHVYK